MDDGGGGGPRLNNWPRLHHTAEDKTQGSRSVLVLNIVIIRQMYSFLYIVIKEQIKVLYAVKTCAQNSLGRAEVERLLPTSGATPRARWSHYFPPKIFLTGSL